MKRIVVGVGGASGAIYAMRLLAFLRDNPVVEADVVFTNTARLVWADEVGTDPAELGFRMFSPRDMTAPFASGSARYDGMVIVPCSAAGLARVAHGVTSDLVGRAADVMLKERRPLVMVLRETPYSLILCRNMVAATEAGATVLPASPSFYSNPADMTQLVDTVVCRVLDQLGIDNALMTRWSGRVKREGAPT